MSNFLAIATVTATLRRILQDALNAAAAGEPGGVSGATVSSLRPDGFGNGMPDKGINVYLYHVSPNAAYRNADLPTRRVDGTLAHRPQVALDLHYLFNFYGQDGQLEPQRLLGITVRTLHSRPVLTRQMIRDTLADPLFSFLAGSDLADQIELVKFMPLNLSLEELSKLWSVFFQTPYVLSVAYQGTLVLIESVETVQTALPVRQPNVYVMPISQPLIEQIISEAGADQPIVADSTLVIRGQRLRGEVTQVRIAGQLVTPSQPISDTRVKLPLSSVPAGKLLAGVQGLQIVHQIMMGTPPVAHRGFESNVAAFVLRPKIKKDPNTLEYENTKSGITGSGDGPYKGNVTLKVAPAIGRAQRVVLLLNQIDPPSDQPAAYTFNAPARDPQTAPETDESITIPIQGVNKATYLVRVQVDGAESPLDVVAEQYAGPKVDIP
jgi:hypothetical protein